MRITRWSNRYQSRRDPQTELRIRLRDLAGTRIRYGYRRLTVLLRREGWRVNTKRVYRLYREEALQVRGYSVKRKGHIGLVNAIAIDAKTGERLGAADPRDHGSAIGY